MTLPQYFQHHSEEEAYFSVGDRVYGTLVVKGNQVVYRFNDGSRPYQDERRFGTDNAAKKFAASFAAYMRKCDQRNSVPLPQTFRDF